MSKTGCQRFVFKVAPSGMPQELAPALGRPHDMVGTLKWSEPYASTKPLHTISRTHFSLGARRKSTRLDRGTVGCAVIESAASRTPNAAVTPTTRAINFRFTPTRTSYAWPH